MKKLLNYAFLILMVIGCKSEEVDYTGLGNLSDAQIQELRDKEKTQCYATYAGHINNARASFHYYFDMLSAGKEVEFKIEELKKSTPSSTTTTTSTTSGSGGGEDTATSQTTGESDETTGKIYFIGNDGNISYILLHDQDGEGTNDPRNRVIIYHRKNIEFTSGDVLTAEDHFTRDILEYCTSRNANNGNQEPVYSSNSTQAFFTYAYIDDQDADDRFTANFNAKFPYFYTLYSRIDEDEDKRIISTLTDTDNVPNKMDCLNLTSLIKDSELCDYDTEARLVHISSSKCVGYSETAGVPDEQRYANLLNLLSAGSQYCD